MSCQRRMPNNTRCGRLQAVLLLAAVLIAASPAAALRPNLRGDLARLEELGRYEEALFFRRSTVDMVLAIHVPWSGAVYDPEYDAFVFETRVDRRYWNIVNNQKRPISDLLAKAALSPAQLDRLEQRVRVYVEDHLSPHFDEMGNFYFVRKAWTLERMGLFHDASARRRLAGHYMLRVCVPYYTSVGRELAMKGNPAQAAAYAARAAAFERDALHQFRLANGDRALSQLQGGNPRQPRDRNQTIGILLAGLKSSDPDARIAAIGALADLEQWDPLVAAAGDIDADVRRTLAEVFAQAMHRPGLQSMSQDADAGIRAIAQKAMADLAAAAPLQSGIRASYFNDPARQQPVAQAVLPSASIGFRGNERFPEKLRGAWTAPDILPANASGQFMVRFDGSLLMPEDGAYRLYVKTEAASRATVRLGRPGAGETVIISPRNDAQLLYSIQSGPANSDLTRIDFSLPVELKRGLLAIQIEYRGAQARTPQGTAGLRLYWSSEHRTMEPVPPAAFFHER